MRRQICPEGQTHFFPDDQMAELLACHPIQEPLPSLPIERNKEVDVDRACKILSASRTTVYRLCKAGVLRGYQARAGGRLPHRLEYASIVEYCDGLRALYRLPRRAPHKGPRPPDDTVLPFPISETITVEEAMQQLDLGRTSIYKLFDSGDLRAYKLFSESKSPWRIERRSLAAYMEKLRRKAAGVSPLRSSPR